MTKILITGGTSFIGRRFVTDILARTSWDVLSLERLPARPARPRVHQLFHDIRAEVPARIVERVKGARYLVHLAADVSGVKSLADPELTVVTNVVGTYNVLEMARKLDLEKFVYMSTGEVVGQAPDGVSLAEDAPLRPSNPYAASKAAAEALVNAYRVSFNLPVIIIRAMNVFGPGQLEPRFIPMAVKAILEYRVINCHIGLDGRCGSRNWLYVEKLSTVLLALLNNGKVGEVYHAVGRERSNIEILRFLAHALDRNLRVENVVPGPSHDLRYALKDTKLGLELSAGSFGEDLANTARSYDSKEAFT